MTLTSYTKYCLEHGDKLNVFVMAEEFHKPSKIEALAKCDAKYDLKKRCFRVEMTKENYKEKCKALRGLQMDFFTKVAE